ncbi:ubiquitin carboxyl-terminal hydrolase 8-like isoform X3 [Belonocnema kinseyi]|uniref:ubiquitin carboxyl-terminal hydrolase 8-like isoform X3 n=1 Tax=Belonocnema kinseyi TaxID=2817044 RepID=UPI00143DEB3D|nr:ubiquitin carboxyl-terminal hydrolase 8-like isoform X3 [Belonocnema kinseyi]
MAQVNQIRVSSMAELIKKSHVDLRGKKPKDVFDRLVLLRSNGDAALKEHQDEKAYIYFKRWQSSVDFIKNSEKNGKQFLSLLIAENQIDEVKKILQKLNEVLSSRFENGKKPLGGLHDSKTKNNSLSPDSSSIDAPLLLPETPPDDPIIEERGEITCMELFQLLKSSENKVLLIDVRPQKEYAESHIKNERCIHIPPEDINHGILCTFFDKYFKANIDNRSRKLFEDRKNVDVTVLLDWKSTLDSLKGDDCLSVMKDLLIKWDPGVKHKRIAILQGGYSEWLNLYPQFVTNPDVKLPNSQENSLNEILDDFEFPQIDDDILSSNKTGNKVVSLVNPNILKEHRAVKDHSTTFEPVDNKAYDAGGRWRSSESLHDQKPVNPFLIENGTPERTHVKKKDTVQPKILFNKAADVQKPAFDRSNKPVLLVQENAETKVLAVMEELYQVRKARDDLDRKMLNLERSFLDARLNGDKITEDIAQSKLFSHKEDLKELDEKRTKLENDLKPINVTKESALKYVNDELQRRFGYTELHKKSISIERKKLFEKFEAEKNEKLSISKKDESDIHKEPLKDSTNTNTSLKRSHSSPNLVQGEDRNVPEVDRTSKPHMTPKENRIINVNNIKRSPMSWKDREGRMEPVFRGESHPGITGLKNLGNSCYMNSIIQCLSNTGNLAKYFNDNSYVEDLNNSNENGTQGQVAEEVAHVIKALWRGQYKSISPRDLKVVIGQYRLQFESYEQQDSHEFLTFLLEWMHNDLKTKDKITVSDLLTPAEKEWIKAMNGQKSIISRLFFGQLRSTITCSTCGKNSTTYETFNSLTMSLPPSTKCTLDDCIRKYVSGQRVFGWKCPHCKTEREATKKFDFIRLAPIVVIHLNRFGESDGWLEKRNTQVDFPLTDFNLRPYVVNDSNTNVNSNNAGYNYSLYAMSNHYGTMEGGHYTAYCKSAPQNKWYKYDDHTVAEVSSNQVKSQNASAYLLFYTSLQTGPYSYI